jgi:hypothetical protein
MSRKYVVGLGLVVGMMFVGGTGMAVAASPSAAPTTTASASQTAAPSATSDASGVKPTTDPAQIAECQKLSASKDAAAVKAIREACAKKFAEVGRVPLGAPQTGGGGMAAVVSTWN